MRRGRAWVVFGGFLAGLAIATSSTHSNAAGPGGGTDTPAPEWSLVPDTELPPLLPILARHDAPAPIHSVLQSAWAPGKPAVAGVIPAAAA